MAMINCENIAQLRTQIKLWRNQAETIAFVPTMGNLHAGHLSLIDIARKKADHVVVSIYVNPLQFAAGEDFAGYPRTLQADLEKLVAAGVELVFSPDNATIYPDGEHCSTFVEVPGLSQIIEGEFRPGFFKGVATVVLKLFNLVQPHYAIFGEKDYQQLLLIRRMVYDLNLPVEVIAGAIKREPDGLAMSSRNNYLSPAERQKSRLLYETLSSLHHQILHGIAIHEAQRCAVTALENHGFVVDYVTVRDAANLAEIAQHGRLQGRELVTLAAAKLGKTRLIDNMRFIIEGAGANKT